MNVGIDLCHIPRMEALIDRQPGFIGRFFTEREQGLFQGARIAQAVAANFAVKEAFSKALGTGVVGFNLVDVEVLRNERGAPYVLLHGEAQTRMEDMGYETIRCSISHDREYAVGLVVLL